VAEAKTGENKISSFGNEEAKRCGEQRAKVSANKDKVKKRKEPREKRAGIDRKKTPA